MLTWLKGFFELARVELKDVRGALPTIQGGFLKERHDSGGWFSSRKVSSQFL